MAVVVIALVSLGWLLVSPCHRQLRALREETAELEGENHRVWWRNVLMQRELGSLRDGPQMIEREARRQLAYGKPGEEPFRPLPADAPELRDRPAAKPRGFLARAGDVVKAYWAKTVMAMLGVAALVIFMADWRLEEPMAAGHEATPAEERATTGVNTGTC